MNRNSVSGAQVAPARRSAILAAASIVVAALLAIPAARSADANAGRAFFRQQCALCHSAEPGDNGGAQGPSLQGVFDRHAAANAKFSYTQALRGSNLTWDAGTLDRFLAAPTAVVPGTAMVIAVPAESDRQNLIEYFRELRVGTFKPALPRGFGPPPGTRFPVSAGKPKGSADWKQDFPGRVHRIELAKLPPPYDTPSAANFPRLVARPKGARLRLPRGFKVAVFANDLPGARAMRVAPNGDVFLSETQTGRIMVLRPSVDGSRPVMIAVFAQGLELPFGMAFYPSGQHPQWLYVAETNRVVRYAYSVGDTTARSVPEIIIPQLSPVAGGGHFTRDLVFSADGKRLFVSVGSQVERRRGDAEENAAGDPSLGSGARPRRRVGKRGEPGQRPGLPDGRVRTREGLRERHPQLCRAHHPARDGRSVVHDQ